MTIRAAIPFVLALLVTASELCGQVTGGEVTPPARGNPDIQLAGESIDAMIAAFVKEHGVAGLAVAIVQAPYITRATGFGVSDTDRRTLVAANTIFDIAQMKNAFTAVAVMQLVEAGALDLDAPITSYLPEAGTASTVRQSLRAPAEYGLLEGLVAQASGQSYHQFVRARQLEPLGLRHTFFAEELPAVPRENLQPGEQHRRFLHEPALIDPTEPATGYRGAGPVAVGSAAIYASAADISIWDIALAGDILVKDAALRRILYSPATLENGTRVPTSGPWFFPGHEGLMVVTGSGAGFSSLLSRFTRSDELVCVTLLANQEGLDLTQLARKIAGAYDPRLGPPAQALRKRVQESPYGVGETMSRFQRVLSERGITIVTTGAASLDLVLPPAGVRIHATAWEERGEVWLAATDPVGIPRRGRGAGEDEAALRMRDEIDAALLQAVSFP
jgi:CubicO group peptidase (beta-lactamase class C family)